MQCAGTTSLCPAPSRNVAASILPDLGGVSEGAAGRLPKGPPQPSGVLGGCAESGRGRRAILAGCGLGHLLMSGGQLDWPSLPASARLSFFRSFSLLSSSPPHAASRPPLMTARTT